MNQNKLTFDTENLGVDWVGFNIEGSIDLEPIANYLFELLGFNSTITKKINGKWKSESLNYDKLNKFQVSFRQYDYNPEFKSYWVGTKVYFSGNNAAHFYKSIKIQPLNLDIFDFQRTSLARFDINYLTELKTTTQTESIKTFMTKSCQKTYAKSKRRKARWNINRKGLLLTIGSRSSSNYYRIYQTEQGVKFELELKNSLVKSFQSFLFNNQIEIFERKLALHFYKLLINQIELNSSYADWLVSWLREIRQKP